MQTNSLEDKLFYGAAAASAAIVFFLLCYVTEVIAFGSLYFVCSIVAYIYAQLAAAERRRNKIKNRRVSIYLAYIYGVVILSCLANVLMLQWCSSAMMAV